MPGPKLLLDAKRVHTIVKRGDSLHATERGVYVGVSTDAPAAGLVDLRLPLQCVENAIQAIFDREHETGAELLKLVPRVHQRRGIRKELRPREEPIEFPRGRPHLILGGTVLAIRLREVPCDPPEHLARGLDDPPCLVLP